jgi:transcriptional regulator with XRE-family HTH domain
MTPSERGPLQKLILDGARDVPGARPTQAKVAEVMGFGDTEYRRFERGDRKLDIDEIYAACEHDELGGAAAVLGPIARRFKLILVAQPVASRSGRDLLRQAAGLTGCAGKLAADVAEATDPASDDGIELSQDERAGILAEIDAAQVRLAQLRADVEAKPRALAVRS